MTTPSLVQKQIAIESILGKGGVRIVSIYLSIYASVWILWQPCKALEDGIKDKTKQINTYTQHNGEQFSLYSDSKNRFAGSSCARQSGI